MWVSVVQWQEEHDASAQRVAAAFGGSPHPADTARLHSVDSEGAEVLKHEEPGLAGLRVYGSDGYGVDEERGQETARSVDQGLSVYISIYKYISI